MEAELILKLIGLLLEAVFHWIKDPAVRRTFCGVINRLSALVCEDQENGTHMSLPSR